MAIDNESELQAGHGLCRLMDAAYVPASELLAKHGLCSLMVAAYATAKDHGWHDKDMEDGTFLALIHAELSEALEGLRNGNPPDSHIPEFTSLEAELADAVIRILDYAAHRNLRLAEAIIAKMKYNEKREHKHGGKAF